MHAGTNTTHPLDQGDILDVVAPFGQPLDAAKIKTNVQGGIPYGFPFTRKLNFVWLF
jgi:hypothetical protein